MNSWKIILATVVIFGAGVVVGGLLVSHVIHGSVHSSRRATATAAVTSTNRTAAARVDITKLKQPELLSQQFVQQLDDNLQLTPVQHDAIAKLIEAGQEQNHSLYTNCAAQSRLVLQEVRQHIREQLNPDQLKEFEKLLHQQTRPAGRRTMGTGTNAAPTSMTVTNGASVAVVTNVVGQ